MGNLAKDYVDVEWGHNEAINLLWSCTPQATVRWQLDFPKELANGAKLFDVTHLPCRSLATDTYCCGGWRGTQWIFVSSAATKDPKSLSTESTCICHPNWCVLIFYHILSLPTIYPPYIHPYRSIQIHTDPSKSWQTIVHQCSMARQCPLPGLLVLSSLSRSQWLPSDAWCRDAQGAQLPEDARQQPSVGLCYALGHPESFRVMVVEHVEHTHWLL